jgi:hypothetical protein
MTYVAIASQLPALQPSPRLTRAVQKPDALPLPDDPSTCAIVPRKECTIEIQKGKSGLGLSIVGGADTLLVGLIDCGTDNNKIWLLVVLI